MAVTYEIIEKIGVFGTRAHGWTQELNIVKWGDNDPKYDIRWWNPDHSKSSKGVTLDQKALEKLSYVLEDYIHSERMREKKGADNETD